MNDLQPSDASSDLIDENQAEIIPAELSDFRSLHPAHVLAERISGWFITAAIGIVGLIIWSGILFAKWPPTWQNWLWFFVFFSFVFGLGMHSHFMPKWEFARCRFRVDDQGIEIHRGVFWRSIINVPRSRIQHTDVHQGPLQRRFSLGSLIIYTAGTQHASVSIHGLLKTDALSYRNILTSQDDHHDSV